MTRQKRKNPELVIPNGYEPEEILDTDDAGYGLETEPPAYREEVKLVFERKQGNESGQRIR